MAFIEIDMMGEEEKLSTTHEDETPPEEFEAMDELDHLYMDDSERLEVDDAKHIRQQFRPSRFERGSPVVEGSNSGR